VAKAVDGVIIGHTNSLHESIANGWPHKRESQPFQIMAHPFRFRGIHRYLGKGPPGILQGATIDITPEEGIECPVLLLNA
jgi:hypothetical protein